MTQARPVSIRNLGANPVHWLACGLGAGTLPHAPGTYGSLVAIPVYFLLLPLASWAYGLTVVLLFALGVWLCGRTARDFGVPDHPAIVWDEIVGMLIALAPAAAAGGWAWVAAGFLLFRLFDIWKPFPIRWLDRRVHGGLGIMLDDVAAGVAAALVLWGLMWLWTTS